MSSINLPYMSIDTRHHTGLNKKQLLDRGWPKELINTHLSPPMRVRGFAPFNHSIEIDLWPHDIVHKAERNPVVMAAIEEKLKKRANRQIAAKKAAKTRRINQERKDQELLNYIDNMKIDIQVISHKKLISYAIESYNANHYKKVSIRRTQPEVIKRIVENFIRHELTNYDGLLYNAAELTGGVCNQAVYDRLRDRVSDKIRDVYPNIL